LKNQRGVDRREFLLECALGTALAGAVPQLSVAAIAAAPSGREASRKWYERSYRRHFFDMHIPDWNEKFLSKLDPEEIVSNLRLENVTAVTLMFLSHTGLAYYPSKVGQVHKKFQVRDYWRETIDLCHRNGIDVVMYYCLLYTDWFWETHPEARTVDIDGNYEQPLGVGIRHAGTLCPNSQIYRDFVVAQLTEICTTYDFEGSWPDMTWWPTVCYCLSCRKRYAAEVGGEIPRIVDWQDPVWVKFQRKRQEWLVEFAHLVTSTIKKHKPGVTVAHQSGQFAWGDWRLGPSVELARETDWLSADTYADRQTQSYFNRLFYSLSELKPFEHVMGWGYPNMKETVITRTVADLRCRAFDAFINDGAMCFLEAFDPEGTLNRDNYVKGGQVFAELEKYEPYGGGVFCQDIAIYRSFDSSIPNSFRPEKVSPEPEDSAPHNAWMHASEHANAAVAAARIFLDNHIPYAVIARKSLPRLSDYQLVILPNVAMLNREEVDAFREYVNQGGSLYASKYTSLLTTDGERQKNFLLADLFGVSYLGESQEVVTYVDPSEKYKDLFLPFKKRYPATLRDSQALVRLDGEAEVIATLTLPYTDPAGRAYASKLTDPPGIPTQYPSVVLNRYGKGKVMYAAGAMEIWEYETERNVLANLLRLLTTQPLHYETDAPKPVEITMFEQPAQKRFIVHLLNHQLELPNIPVTGVTVSVWMRDRRPLSVSILPEGKRLDFVLRDGRVHFQVPRLETYMMVGLSYA